MIPGLDDLRDRVTELRQDAGVTQAEAAAAADVSQSFVAKLEAGTAVPNYRAAARLYNTLEDRARAAGEQAADVMHTDVVAVEPDDTVATATGRMTAEGFSQLPVIDDGDCVGSVTSRRLLDAADEEQVRECTGPAFPTVPAGTGIDAVKELLDSANAVLVRENDKIDGIITAADVL
ncbi:MAG: CBS domain-containing protein [Candidatus Nanohaloarchaea archaeon]|nr:CBS domain-containing protein [Candidatus Nanohaloarchaea archaeon]